MTAPGRFSYTFRDFRLDPVEKVLFHDGRPVPLTPKAVETLLALVERDGHLVTKEDLLRIVWPDTFVEENNLAQNISTLRRVLGESGGDAPIIETVPKRGYRFLGPVDKRVHGGPPGEADKDEADKDVPPEEIPRRGALRQASIWGLVAVVPLLLAIVAASRTNLLSGRPSGKPSADSPVTRMAVLPFVNLGAADDAYFVAGMTEEIAGRLASLRSLAVSSSTTVMGYDRRGKSVRQIGADLGVEYVVEGSVRWARDGAGTQVRITPKLIRVTDDSAVWTQQYDASLSDLFRVQADIAYRVADALQVALEARERRAVDARPTTNTAAYLAYLRGTTAFQQSAPDTGYQAKARADLEQAVALDPRFATAWSALARVYAWQYNTGAQRTPETVQLARGAAQTAMALNPDLPDAHLGLAQVLIMERAYDAALRELKIARDGLPNSPELWRMIGAVLRRQGQWTESLGAFTRAFADDPASTAEQMATHYIQMRQYAEVKPFIGVLQAGDRPVAAVPEGFMGFTERGDIAAARRALEPALSARAPADARVRGLLARFEWFDGRHQRALEVIAGMDAAGAWLPANFRFPASLAAAQVYESMGRREEAATRYAAAIADLERRQRDAPDDYQIEAALGLAAAGIGRAEDAVRHGERAVQLLPVSRDAAEGPLYLYWLAQIHARLGQADAAFATLDRMFSVPGFYNERWIERDPGFATLWTHPKFRAHVERWSKQKGDALITAAPSASRPS